jgi:hypothetical protein
MATITKAAERKMRSAKLAEIAAKLAALGPRR